MAGSRKKPEVFDNPYFTADNFELEADLSALARGDR